MQYHHKTLQATQNFLGENNKKWGEQGSKSKNPRLVSEKWPQRDWMRLDDAVCPKTNCHNKKCRSFINHF